jgi:hypothetical protein
MTTMNTDTFNAHVWMSLSYCNRRRVEHIYCLAVILHNNGVKPLSTHQFDMLYDMPVLELECYVGQMNVFLNNIDGE